MAKTKSTPARRGSRPVARWSGRILKPIVKPKAFNLTQLRRAIRDERKAAKESAGAEAVSENQRLH